MEVMLAAGRSIVVRQYSSSQLRRRAVFFPGQRGGISDYERTLFSSVQQLGIRVFALSYPGQDDARGRSLRATLLGDVDRSLAAIGQGTSCNPADSVFIGRSLGATVAVLAAERTRPKGLLLEGVAPTITTAIRSALRNRVVTRPWRLLPIWWLVKNDFSLESSIRSLVPIPIVIFQGTNDRITPFVDAQEALLPQGNVEFIAVEGASHHNAYRLAKAEYLEKLAELAAR